MIKMSEQEYNELYKYSLKAAYQYVGYSDAAYDIAQNALLSFITSKSPIESPQAWLKVVLRREASKYFKETKKETEIIKKAKIEQQIASEDDRDTDRILALKAQKLKTLLSPADYKVFLKLKKFKFSVQSYSLFEGVSYNTARNQKLRIKRNILSALLWEEGWRHSIKVLNYQQYYNVSRFINTIISSVQSGKLNDLIHYTSQANNEEVMRVFSHVKECLEWTVSLHRDFYNVFLVCNSHESNPLFCTLRIKIAKNNTINIIDVADLVGFFEGEGDFPVLERFNNKGKYEFTNEQYLKTIKQNLINTTHEK